MSQIHTFPLSPIVPTERASSFSLALVSARYAGCSWTIPIRLHVYYLLVLLSTLLGAHTYHRSVNVYMGRVHHKLTFWQTQSNLANNIILLFIKSMNVMRQESEFCFCNCEKESPLLLLAPSACFSTEKGGGNRPSYRESRKVQDVCYMSRLKEVEKKDKEYTRKLNNLNYT